VARREPVEEKHPAVPSDRGHLELQSGLKRIYRTIAKAKIKGVDHSGKPSQRNS
jgi:hypothetical protein